jgi:hypothetical protein
LESKSGFTQAISSEKHERIARRSLLDIVSFYQMVEQEMQDMQKARASGADYDEALLERMSLVADQYKRVMSGFLELDDNSQRHALIEFADVAQDLVKYIHMQSVSA